MSAVCPDTGITTLVGSAEHGAAVGCTVVVLRSVIWTRDARLQGIFQGTAGLGGDAGIGADARCIGIAKDAVVERVAEIV